MGCTSCTSNGNGSPRGCKSNGTCGTDSCNKLTVFDWLGNMEMPKDVAPFPLVEVLFKEQLWYAYKGEWMNWHMLSLESVNEIIIKNNKIAKIGKNNITGKADNR